MSYSHLIWKLETHQQERFQTAWCALLVKKSRFSEEEKHYCLEIVTCNTHDFILSSHWSEKG